MCDSYNVVTYQAAIYDWATQPRPHLERMAPQPPARYVIPGLKVGCFPYDAMAASTLECFFSAECLNETAKWISNLPSSSWPQPLNDSAHKSFEPTDLFVKLLDKTMVDDWETLETYETYYNACTPIECVYTTKKFSGLLYLISTLLGLCGGLIVALRTIAPVLVQTVLRISARFSQKANSNGTKTNKNCGIEINLLEKSHYSINCSSSQERKTFF